MWTLLEVKTDTGRQRFKERYRDRGSPTGTTNPSRVERLLRTQNGEFLREEASLFRKLPTAWV